MYQCYKDTQMYVILPVMGIVLMCLAISVRGTTYGAVCYGAGLGLILLNLMLSLSIAVHPHTRSQPNVSYDKNVEYDSPLNHCSACLFSDKGLHEQPCLDCEFWNKFQPKE